MTEGSAVVQQCLATTTALLLMNTYESVFQLETLNQILPIDYKFAESTKLLMFSNIEQLK